MSLPPPPALTKPARRCPFCAEEIQAEARKCKHCAEYLVRDDTPKGISSSRQPVPRAYLAVGIVFVGLLLGGGVGLYSKQRDASCMENVAKVHNSAAYAGSSTDRTMSALVGDSPGQVGVPNDAAVNSYKDTCGTSFDIRNLNEGQIAMIYEHLTAQGRCLFIYDPPPGTAMPTDVNGKAANCKSAKTPLPVFRHS